MKRSRRPGRLHVITDATLQGRFDHATLARLATEGGAETIQLREKRPLPTAELVRIGHRIREQVGDLVWFVIDDRIDVAAACGADGVHLGPLDTDPGSARRLLGADALIGGTANAYGRALSVARQPVDYVGVGPVFGTRSKADPAPMLGLDRLGRIVRALNKPVIAIGGITPDRVEAVLAAGAHGVAVLSAVVRSHDPAAATAAFREAIDRCRKVGTDA